MIKNKELLYENLHFFDQINNFVGKIIEFTTNIKFISQYENQFEFMVKIPSATQGNMFNNLMKLKVKFNF